MAKRLLSYPIDAEDEIESLRERLNAANIEFYETPGSRWGFSNPTIWINNDDEFSRAKQVLDEHAVSFAEKARIKYQQETGYDPNATGEQKLYFLLRYWSQRKGLVVAAIVGLGIVAIYFVMFIKMFF